MRRKMFMISSVVVVLTIGACEKRQPPPINTAVESAPVSLMQQLDQVGIQIKLNTLTVVCDPARGNLIYIVGGGGGFGGTNGQIDVALAVVHQPCQ
ncbi:MAG: hypothetical protein G01um101413_395 [Parcubacteria group bacterium Gr01-1014_13]|nr:MAG: hypothetical protein G01um101413_395 [Parcubacteria group bacterium Gr01-1014_13]